jgi:phospholipid/cholesterol/gamma-HCH transport system ATP-binding protein
MEPDEGQVIVGGRDICSLSKRELGEVRSRVSYLFQGVALFDSLSVFDNVALPLREKTTMSESDIYKQVMDHLDMVSMAHAVNKYPSELSGGMQKRVGLARALQRNPDVVLFDEPTTGLDPETTFNIYNLFRDTQKMLGYTALIVSHDIPKVFRIADEIAVLSDGFIKQVPIPQKGEVSSDPWLEKMMTLETDSLKGVLF